MGLPATGVMRVNLFLPFGLWLALRARGIGRLKPQAGCRIVLKAASRLQKAASLLCGFVWGFVCKANSSALPDLRVFSQAFYCCNILVKHHHSVIPLCDILLYKSNSNGQVKLI